MHLAVKMQFLQRVFVQQLLYNLVLSYQNAIAGNLIEKIFPSLQHPSISLFSALADNRLLVYSSGMKSFCFRIKF